MLASALLSLAGAFVIIFSALRFRELSKRFFAIRLIFFLALTDCFAALFNILGAFVDVDALLRSSGKVPFLCVLQAVGLLYFNLASILWTSCFAFTLYRDVVPSHRRHALRGYELYFHLLCWPVPAVLAGAATRLGYLGDAGSWCALGLAYSFQYLVCFYVPLLIAFAFNVVTYAAVLAHSRERRVSRITSLYLLGFAVVWLPSLLCRFMVFLSGSKAPPYALAALEAACMPLQGALNALVYGWSLPSIRDVYRAMLLGTDSLEIERERPPSVQSDYSPPQPPAVACSIAPASGPRASAAVSMPPQQPASRSQVASQMQMQAQQQQAPMRMQANGASSRLPSLAAASGALPGRALSVGRGEEAVRASREVQAAEEARAALEREQQLAAHNTVKA